MHRQFAAMVVALSIVPGSLCAQEKVARRGPVKLTDEALKYWTRQTDDAERSGRGSKGGSAMAKDVNQEWTQRTLDETADDVPF